MKEFKILKGLVLCCIMLYISTSSIGQDWPGWRGIDRDGKVKNFKCPEKWPDQLKLIWKKTVGLGDASPAMQGNSIFLITKQDVNEVALCIDAKTGDLKWQTTLNAATEVTGGARSHPGPRATPTIAGDKVFTLGVGGQFNCLDAKTGKVLWKNESFLEVPQFFTSVSALVKGDLCIVHLGGKENGTIVAFKVNNGEIAWKLEKEPATYSSPVLMKIGKEVVVVLQTETHLIGVSLKGELLWKYATPSEQRFYNSTTPLVDGTKIYIVGQGKGTAALEITNSGNSYNVSEVWRNPDFGGSFNTPVLKNGFLYGNEARLGKLYCIDASSGKTAWADTVSYNRFAATLDLGDALLSQPANGKLVFYKPDPSEYKNLATYKVSDTEIYASPLVSNKIIYVKDKEDIICYMID